MTRPGGPGLGALVLVAGAGLALPPLPEGGVQDAPTAAARTGSTDRTDPTDRAGSTDRARAEAQDGAPVDWERLAAIDDPAERTRAVVAALGRAPEPLSDEAVRTAHRVGVELAQALRLDLAADLQGALHERARAPWSAISAALTRTRAGDYAGADEILTTQLERTAPDDPARPDLLARWALVAWGEGRERVALDRLGRALAAGSPEAAVVLARHHLARGDLSAARAGFRALLLGPEPGAWALRGWGLTLIAPREP